MKRVFSLLLVVITFLTGCKNKTDDLTFSIKDDPIHSIIITDNFHPDLKYSANEDRAQTMMDYFRNLDLTTPYLESPSPYDYTGSTTIITVEYADNSQDIIYYKSGLFISKEGGYWYKINYTEAEQLNKLIQTLGEES